MKHLIRVILLLIVQLTILGTGNGHAQLGSILKTVKGAPKTNARELKLEAELANTEINQCEEQVMNGVGTVEAKYKKFQKEGVDIFNQFGVWFTRVALEEARFYLHSEKEVRPTRGRKSNFF